MRDTAQSSPAEGIYDFDNYSFDGQGRTQYRYTRTTDANHGTNDFLQEAHYYEGTGKLAVFERHVGDLQQTSLDDQRGLIETYRYDALGRRVLLRTLRTQYCSTAGCDSPVQRFVWDGDQLLYETRGNGSTAAETDGSIESDMPGGSSASGAFNAYGVVAYTHAGGIDRPIGVMRMSNGALLAAFYPQTNWRGQYELATLANGTQLPNDVAWPGKIGSAYLGVTPRSSPYEWFGNLMTEQADASGLMYRRNRYYDPKSGRFTQPDPIGIAGGLNAYGFAGGDPVTYSDPFGLCPVTKEHPEPCPVSFLGVSVNAAYGWGVTGGAGVYWTKEGVGVYGRYGAIPVGIDVSVGSEGGAADSETAFGGLSVGACGGVNILNGCQSSNADGTTTSGGAAAGPSEILVSGHIEVTNTKMSGKLIQFSQPKAETIPKMAPRDATRVKKRE